MKAKGYAAVLIWLEGGWACRQEGWLTGYGVKVSGYRNGRHSIGWKLAVNIQAMLYKCPLQQRLLHRLVGLFGIST